MSLKIRVADTLDWGCEHTAEDVSRYEDEITDQIKSAFPEADVDVSCELRGKRLITITHRDSEGRIDVSWETRKHEDEMEATIDEICRDTWDRGDFWAPAASDDGMGAFTGMYEEEGTVPPSS